MSYILKKLRFQALLADTIILVLLALAGEFISQKGLERYRSDFFFSIAALPLFVLLFRWGFWGLPSLFIFGLIASFILTGFTYETLIINFLGYPGLALGMILFIRSGRDRIISHMYNAFLYIFVGFIGMTTLRALVLTLFEADFMSSILLIMANETLSFIACALLFTIMRKRKEYLVYIPDLYKETELSYSQEKI